MHAGATIPLTGNDLGRVWWFHSPWGRPCIPTLTLLSAGTDARRPLRWRASSLSPLSSRAPGTGMGWPGWALPTEKFITV